MLKSFLFATLCTLKEKILRSLDLSSCRNQVDMPLWEGPPVALRNGDMENIRWIQIFENEKRLAVLTGPILYGDSGQSSGKTCGRVCETHCGCANFIPWTMV